MPRTPNKHEDEMIRLSEKLALAIRDKDQGRIDAINAAIETRAARATRREK